MLLSLQSLLGGEQRSTDCVRNIFTPRLEPNNSSPLNTEAASLWDQPNGIVAVSC
jgi:hypothetical protein